MSYTVQNGDLIVNGLNVTAGLAALRSTIAAKAEADDLANEVSAREQAVSSIHENLDPTAIDSFTEVVTEMTAIRDAMAQADGEVQQAVLTLAQDATIARQVIQDDLDTYKSTNNQALADEVLARQQAVSSVSGTLSTYQASNDQALADLATSADERMTNIEGAATALTTRVTATEGVNETQDTSLAAIATAMAGLLGNGSMQQA